MLTARAESEQALCDVAKEVLQILKRVMGRTPEASEPLLRLGVLVPRALIPGFLGPGAQAVRQLCEESGAIIKVHKATGIGFPEDSQEVLLRGSAQALQHVLERVSGMIQASHQELWYPTWAASHMGDRQREGGRPRSASRAPSLQPAETGADATGWVGQRREASETGGPGATGSASSTSRVGEGDGVQEAARPHTADSGTGGSGADDLNAMGRAAPHTVVLAVAPQLVAALGDLSGSEQLRELRDLRLSHSLSPPAEIRPWLLPWQWLISAKAEDKHALDELVRRAVVKQQELAGSAPDDAICYEGMLKISLLFPRAAVSILIGRKGVVIRQIMEHSGADIRCRQAPASPSSSDPQRVDLRGKTEAILSAYERMSNLLQDYRDNPWYVQWASREDVTSAGRPWPLHSPVSPHSGRPRSPSSHHGPPRSGVDPVRAAPVPAGGDPWPVETSDGAARQPAMNLMGQVMDGLPHYVTEETRGFAMMCVVPRKLIGYIIGKGGSGLREVQTTTKTKVAIRDVAGDADSQSLNIAGPLLNATSAYMMLMKRYSDISKRGFGRYGVCTFMAGYVWSMSG